MLSVYRIHLRVQRQPRSMRRLQRPTWARQRYRKANTSALAISPPKTGHRITQPGKWLRITAVLCDLVPLWDVMQIQSIAQELRSESDALASFCDELVRLAEDFDFDGIQKFVFELDS